MRRTVVALMLVLGACRSGGPRPSTAPTPAVVGAAGPRQAVEQFLASIRAGDVQATSIIWGTARGPARERMRDRTELEKRILIMQCNFNHDASRIISDLPGSAGARNLKVELRRGQLVAQTTMSAVLGPDARWFVENADLAPMRGFCSSQPQEPRR